MGTGSASSAWQKEREKIISRICEQAKGRSKSKPVGSMDGGVEALGECLLVGKIKNRAYVTNSTRLTPTPTRSDSP